jgi:hypothetical protein
VGNVTPPRWVDVATLSVSCQRKQFNFWRQSEQSLVQLDAQGKLSVDGRPGALLPR